MPIQYIAHPISANIRDETGARAIGGGPYVNARLRPIQVVISMTHQVNLLNSFCLAQLAIGGVGGVSWGGWFNTPAAGSIKYSTLVGNIPPGGTYQLTENALGGVNTILAWIEVDQ